MSFAVNLQRIRRERRLSQEELAEKLDVSRQAVSKWEQGTGYPEAEKLLLISRELNVSLDSLMGTGIVRENPAGPDEVTGTIVISSPHEHVIVRCRQVMSSPKFRGGKNSPQYALFAVSGDAVSFWGPQSTFLGWYANAEHLNQEIAAIRDAVFRGIPAYELKYSAKVKRKLFSVKLSEDQSPSVVP